jgi:hypothetical protein
MQDAKNLGYRRNKNSSINKRYGDLLSGLAAHPPKNIPSSFKSWKETIAAYRFLIHKNITSDKILAPHIEATLARIKSDKFPGAKVMWIGMQRMKDFTLARETFHSTKRKLMYKDMSVCRWIADSTRHQKITPRDCS